MIYASLFIYILLWQEAGIDGGGLFKEFIDLLLNESFNPANGLFLTTEQHLQLPNPSAISKAHCLEYFTFIGRMLGKAMYEKVLVEPHFAGMFLNQLLGRQNFIDDLQSLDEGVRVCEVYEILVSDGCNCESSY